MPRKHKQRVIKEGIGARNKQRKSGQTIK